jgi:hypothetical protein
LFNLLGFSLARPLYLVFLLDAMTSNHILFNYGKNKNVHNCLPIHNTLKTIKGGQEMGKKHRNRVNQPKKNNHIPEEQMLAEHEAHGKEQSAAKRKNSPGHHLRDY